MTGVLKRLRILWVVLLLAAWAGPAEVSGQVVGDFTVWLPLVQYDQAPPNPVVEGVATYYYATGAGACSFGASSEDPLLVAALDPVNFDSSNACGSYVFVSGPKGSVTVRITDLCPGCAANHIDLSEDAFAAIADLVAGRVNVTWQVVSPELTGPVGYHFKSGSNQWWTAVQVRNHRNPVAKFEYLRGSEWVEVNRTSYNYFVQTGPGMGVGPYTFRITDAYGNQLVDSNIPHRENETVDGVAQFPYGP